MKKKIQSKMIIEAVIVLAVAVAFLMPTSAIVTNPIDTQKPVVNDGLQNYVVKSMKTGRGSSYSPRVLSEGDDVRISVSVDQYPSGGNDTMPAITRDANWNIVVTWTNQNVDSGYNTGLTYSSFPLTSEAVQSHWVIFEGLTGGGGDINDIYGSDIAMIRGPLSDDYKGLYGVFLGVDPGAEQAGNYIIPDVTGDPNDPTYAQFSTWQGGAPEAKYAAVADSGFYYEPNGNYDGPVNMYVYNYDATSTIGAPIYVNNNIRGGAGASSTFYIDAQTKLLSAPAKDPDMACLDGRFHLAWYFHNETLDKNQVIWKKVDPAVEADIEYTPYQKYMGLGAHPAIAAYGNNVVILYMNETNAITCVRSANDGTDWTTTTLVANGSYPDIYAKKGKFYATYIDKGNLSMVNSSDGGATWGTAIRINDVDNSVIAEENAVDLNEGGIVWVDNRDGNKSIYYQQIFIREPEPKLEITITHGFGLGVKAVLKNNGTAAATNVFWEITGTGGLVGFIKLNKNGTIPSIAPGESVDLSTGMFLGFGTFPIVAKAHCDEGKSAEDSASGTQLIILTIVK